MKYGHRRVSGPHAVVSRHEQREGSSRQQIPRPSSWQKMMISDKASESFHEQSQRLKFSVQKLESGWT